VHVDKLKPCFNPYRDSWLHGKTSLEVQDVQASDVIEPTQGRRDANNDVPEDYEQTGVRADIDDQGNELSNDLSNCHSSQPISNYSDSVPGDIIRPMRTKRGPNKYNDFVRSVSSSLTNNE